MFERKAAVTATLLLAICSCATAEDDALNEQSARDDAMKTPNSTRGPSGTNSGPNRHSGTDHSTNQDQGADTKTANAALQNYIRLIVGAKMVYANSWGGKTTTKIVSYGDYYGHKAYKGHTVYSTGHSDDSYLYEDENSDVYVYNQHDERYVLSIDGPPQDGKSWSSSYAGVRTNMRWEWKGNFSVPAGDFASCYILRMSTATSTGPIESYVVYAPSVGAVFSWSPNGSTSLIEYEEE